MVIPPEEWVFFRGYFCIQISTAMKNSTYNTLMGLMTARTSIGEIVDYISRNSIDIDAVYENTEESLLGSACDNDDVGFACFILEAGADPNAPGYIKDGRFGYPLQMAKSGAMTQVLLEHNADPLLQDSNGADSVSHTMAKIIHGHDPRFYYDKLYKILDQVLKVNKDYVNVLTDLFSDGYPVYIKGLVMKDIEENPNNVKKLARSYAEDMRQLYHPDHEETDIDSN